MSITFSGDNKVNGEDVYLDTTNAQGQPERKYLDELLAQNALAYVGPQGIQGPPGATGATGATGPTGAQGPQG